MSSTGSDPASTSPSALALPFWAAPAVILVGVLGMMIGGAIAQMAGFGLRGALMTAEAGLVLPSLLFIALSGRPVVRSLELRAPDAPTIALSLLAGATLWMASLGLMSVQSAFWPPSEAFLDSFRWLHRALRPKDLADGVLSLVTIAATPALCEEIVFRGTALPALRRRLPASAAILLSALLFGCIHIDVAAGAFAFYRIPFAIAVGAGLGALRLLTGSLVPAILAHACLNAITFLTVLFSGPSAESMENLSPAIGVPLLLGGTGATAILLSALRRRIHARLSG